MSIILYLTDNNIRNNNVSSPPPPSSPIFLRKAKYIMDINYLYYKLEKHLENEKNKLK
ncbi:MAG: hypothetical protein [Cotesia congregata filamentous virus 2]